MPTVLLLICLYGWPPDAIRFPVAPVDPGTRVTQRYSRHHHGIDFAVPRGTPVVNVALGIVTEAGNTPREACGRHVIVQGLGAYSGYQWSYCHLSQIDVVEGQQLEAMDRIGLSGNTGRSTGPHLHFTVLKAGQWVNPRLWR